MTNTSKSQKSQNKTWQIYPNQDTIAKKISTILNCSSVIAHILLNRSIKNISQASLFLTKQWHDFPLLPNQKELISTLKQLINKNAAFCVYGDYDVDGVTSTAMMVSILRQCNCKVDFISPHRFNDGYGLNLHRIKEIAKKNYDALITLDCGSTNYIEIDELKKLAPSITVLIIDHHKCNHTLPNADVIVNTQLSEEDHPARHLCTAALIDYIFRTTPIDGIDIDKFIDLVAIGLIADVMPLVNLNRWYVNLGLNQIKENPRKAILELCISAKVNHQTITSHDIGFSISNDIAQPWSKITLRLPRFRHRGTLLWREAWGGIEMYEPYGRWTEHPTRENYIPQRKHTEYANTQKINT